MSSQFLDLDAFVPPEQKKVRIGGSEYPVIDIIDLCYQDYLELASIEERLAALPESKKVAEIRRQIKKLIPSCPADLVDDMSLRKLGWLLAFIQKVSEMAGSDPLASAAPSN